jgi:hypothetical protein
MGNKILALFLVLLSSLAGHADEETPNSIQARRIFDTAYNQVFGEQGSKLHYDVNIIGLYKTNGTIWLKGKKQKFIDNRVTSWSDGKTAYMAYKKKKTVEIYDANSNKKDKFSGRFKFSLDDFTYNIKNDSDGLMLILKQKKKVKGTIKEVRALVDRTTYAPIKIRIKVAFIWTTIRISDFQSGSVSDEEFVFPADKYSSGWKFHDNR